MNLRYLVSLFATGVALNLQSLPASAFEGDPFERLETITPEALIKGIVREDDVTLLFKHMRESMAAAARGEAARESEALNRRAEQIQREVAVRGSILAGALLSVFESAVKQMVREGLSEFESSLPRDTPYPRSGTID